MALTFPRDPRVEFYLDGWQDVSTDVRQQPAILVSHGRKDWATKTSPSLAKFTLDDGPDHGDGDFDPNNPLGQWFGTLGRNTPMRVSLAAAQDTFTRSFTDGWGTATSGELWSVNTGSGGTVQASDFQVNGSVGTHSVPATLAYRYSVLDVSYRDVEVTATATVGVQNITGGPIEPANVMCRWQDLSTYYMTRVSISSAEVLTISIHHSITGQLVAPVTVAGLVDAVSNKVVRVKMQAEGQTIRAKVYAPGAEPVGWHVEVQDTLITTAGKVGVRSGVSSTNTNTLPIVFSVDDFEVRIPRFSGETSKMVPLTSTDHTDQRTQVECASVRRRLGKGEKVLDPAFKRYVDHSDLSFTVTDLWMLDEPANASAKGSSATGGQPAVFSQNAGSGVIKWGVTDKVLTSVPGFVSLHAEGQLDFTVDTTDLGSVSSVMWGMKISPNTGGRVLLGTTAGTNRWVFFLYNDGTYELYANPSGGLVTSGIFQFNTGLEDEWLSMGLTLFDNGAGNIGYHINENGASLGVGSWTSDGSYTALNAVTLRSEFDPSGGTGENAFSTLVVTASRWDTAVSGKSKGTWASEIIRGRVGEAAGTRFARLCAEENISVSMSGTPSDTPLMGPQTPTTLRQLLQECVDVDQGAAFDPRGTTGLGMRTHRATTTQDPVLTLEYEGQVAPEFGPTTDDQGTINDVTAKRPGGGEYRIEQTTGPNNTADPGTNPQAAGRADTTVTTNVATDLNLPDQAGWRVHMGTVEGPRYPTLTVDLAADDVAADPDLVAAVLDVEVDDRVDITGAAVRRIFDDVRLVARGYTETFNTAYQHKIVFNCTPYEPLNVGVYGDADSRRDTAGSSLDSDITSSATSFTVDVTKGQPWTTTAAQFPLDIVIGGERIRISSIAAPSSATPPLTQVFTVAASGRSINGVVKAHSAGAAVQLFDPVYYGH
jgi:hypothetical protein